MCFLPVLISESIQIALPKNEKYKGRYKNMLGKSLKRITAAILAVSMSLNSYFIIHAGMEDEVYRTQE